MNVVFHLKYSYFLSVRKHLSLFSIFIQITTPPGKPSSWLNSFLKYKTSCFNFLFSFWFSLSFLYFQDRLFLFCAHTSQKSCDKFSSLWKLVSCYVENLDEISWYERSASLSFKCDLVYKYVLCTFLISII